MKKATSPYLLLWAVLCFSILPSYGSKSQGIHEESISARSYRAIQAAMPALEGHKLDINNYRITVIESSASLSVLFHDPEAPPGDERRPGRPPGVSIGLDKDTFDIIVFRLQK